MNTEHLSTGSCPSQSPAGLFLPTGVWTSDRQVAEQEKQRLLPWRTALHDLTGKARDSDNACIWYLMAEAALAQIDRDLDDLYEWLEATERGDFVREELEG